ncbi:MAG: hypothetical protein RR396_01990, partial [Clostridiales bacterium]
MTKTSLIYLSQANFMIKYYNHPSSSRIQISAIQFSTCLLNKDLNKSPLSSKFLNISQLAQAGES